MTDDIKIEFVDKFQKGITKKILGIKTEFRQFTARERSLFRELASRVDENDDTSINTFVSYLNEVLTTKVISFDAKLSVNGTETVYVKLSDEEKGAVWNAVDGKYYDAVIAHILEASSLSEEEIGFLGKRSHSKRPTRR